MLDRRPVKFQGCAEEGHVIRNCVKKKKKKHHKRNGNQGKFDKSLKYNAAPARGNSDKNDDSGDNVFAVGLNVMKGDDCWTIDSGASQHMTSNRNLLNSIYQENGTVAPFKPVGEVQSKKRLELVHSDVA